MKEFIAKYQKAIVGTGAVSVLLICFLQQKELAKLRSERDSLIHHMVDAHAMEGGNIKNAQLQDSLQNELFIQKTIVGRYEVAVELFKDENPKGAQQFQSILSTKTE
jgi:hypothetical protein